MPAEIIRRVSAFRLWISPAASARSRWQKKLHKELTLLGYLKTFTLLGVALSLVSQGAEPALRQDETLVVWLASANQLLIFEATA